MSRKMEKIEDFNDPKLKILSGAGVRVPKLPKALSKEDTPEDRVTLITEGVRQISNDVPEAFNYLRTLESWIKGKKSALERKIAVRETLQRKEEMERYIEDCLFLEEEFFRAAAAKAYLKCSLEQTFASTEEAHLMLADLTKRKILVPVSGGAIEVGFQRYNFGDFGLDSDDQEEIQSVISNFSRSLKKLVREQREKSVEDIKRQVTRTPKEFFEKEPVPGKYVLTVPAESYDRDGTPGWRAGGEILFEVRGKEIIPVQGVGQIEASIVSMVEKEIRLRHDQIHWDRHPGAGAAFPRTVNGMMANLQIPKDEAEDRLRKIQSLWYMIRRAREHSRDQERLIKIRDEEYASEATISPKEFFGIGGDGVRKDGVALLVFEGAFNCGKAVPVYNIFLLVERKRIDGTDSIRIVKYPEHCAPVLSPFFHETQPKWYASGDDFKSLPPQLGRLFRGIRGRVDLENEIASPVS